MSDEDVVGHNGMCHAAHHLTTIVHQIHSYLHRVLRHRNKKYVLKSLVHVLCLVVCQPLLEKRREGVAVYHGVGLSVTYCYLSVAFHRQFVQMCFLAIPSWHKTKFVNGNFLMRCVA